VDKDVEKMYTKDNNRIYFTFFLYNDLIMKNKSITHSYEESRIYRDHYRPSLNVFRFFRAILGAFISGSSPAAHATIRSPRSH